MKNERDLKESTCSSWSAYALICSSDIFSKAGFALRIDWGSFLIIAACWRKCSGVGTGWFGCVEFLETSLDFLVVWDLLPLLLLLLLLLLLFPTFPFSNPDRRVSISLSCMCSATKATSCGFSTIWSSISNTVFFLLASNPAAFAFNKFFSCFADSDSNEDAATGLTALWHECLCRSQWLFWQSLLQYNSSLHPPHKCFPAFPQLPFAHSRSGVDILDVQSVYQMSHCYKLFDNSKESDCTSIYLLRREDGSRSIIHLTFPGWSI